MAKPWRHAIEGADLLATWDAVTLLRGWGLSDAEARDILDKRAQAAQYAGPERMYAAAEVRRVAEPYRTPGGLAGTADMEYETRIEAERCTLQLRARGRRLDRGKRSIEDSPLFGGERQSGLF